MKKLLLEYRQELVESVESEFKQELKSNYKDHQALRGGLKDNWKTDKI